MPNLYHVTSVARLKDIIGNREGLLTNQTPLSTENILNDLDKEIDESEDLFEEEFEDCSAIAENELNEILTDTAPKKYRRGRDSVYFWGSLGKALHTARLLQKNVSQPLAVIEVDSHKVNCTCYKADAEITDDIHDEYLSGCYGSKMPDEEKIESLAEDYWESASDYTPCEDIDQEEIVCPCDISPNTIAAIYDITGKKKTLKRDWAKSLSLSKFK